MRIDNFKDMYIAELQELASVERQLDTSLARLSEMASHPELKDALARHREDTQQQQRRLEELLQKHRASPKAHTDQAMQALIDETEKMHGILQGDGLRDAGLIASVQKIEHYEMAAFGTAAALAGQLDLRDDQQMLHRCLEQACEADAQLSALAKREVNADALAS